MRDLPRLTSLRAFAALAVFGFHVGTQGPHWRPAEIALPHGYAGVSFFFVLSGFVLTWSARPGERRRDFYQRRFARVWPLHIVTAILAIALGSAVTARALFPNLLLVQAWAGRDDVVFGINAPSWSLSCEAFFYACFPLLFMLAQRTRTSWFVAFAAGILGVSAAITFAAAVAGPPWQNLAYANPAARVAEFVVGIALCRIIQAGRRPRFGVSAAGGATAALAVVAHVLNPPLPLPDLLLLPGFCAVIAAAAAGDLSGRVSALGRSSLVYAGQVSFAFYLVHSLVITKVDRLLPNSPTPARVLLALLVAALAAVVLHEAVEKPAQRLISPRRHKTAAPASSAA